MENGDQMSTGVAESNAKQKELLTREKLLNKKEDKLKARENKLTAKDEKLNAREKQLDASKKDLKSHKKELKIKDKKLDAREAQLRKKESRLDAREQTIQQNSRKNKTTLVQLSEMERQLHFESEQLDLKRDEIIQKKIELRQIQASGERKMVFGGNPTIRKLKITEVFANLLGTGYLTKTQLVEFRLVSKLWRSGVDRFLAICSVKQPGFIDDAELLYGRIYNTDFYDRQLPKMIQQRGLEYTVFTSSGKMKKMIDEVAYFPKCKILGRSVSIKVFPWYAFPNRNFLEVFGDQILSLRIEIKNSAPVDMLRRILELLATCSKLKKLELAIDLDDLGKNQQPLTRKREQSELSDFMEKWIGNGILDKLPKLEMLKIRNDGRCDRNLNYYLLTLLANKSVERLWLKNVSIQANLKPAALIDLLITINKQEDITRLLLNGPMPLKRLALRMGVACDATQLANLVQNFGSTLETLDLKFLPEFFLKSDDLGRQLEKFAQSNLFKGLVYVKTLYLEGYHPISLNFLCGMRNSLEYLHMDETDVDSCSDLCSFRSHRKEILDLKQKVEHSSSYSINQKMYESNVWKVFPRLKGITVKVQDRRCSRTKLLVFRRDAYQKVQEERNMAARKKVDYDDIDGCCVVM